MGFEKYCLGVAVQLWTNTRIAGLSFLVCLVLSSSGCGTPETGEADGHLVYQGPEGLMKVPFKRTGLRFLGVSSDRIVVKLVAPPIRGSEKDMGHGNSGAPAYTNEGDFLGSLVNTVGDMSSPYLLIESRDSLLAALRRGRRHRPPKAIQMVNSTAYTELKPGDSVALAWSWGDIVQKASGILALREGKEVLLFGHGRIKDGERIYGMFRTRPVAVDHGEESGGQVSILRELIGRVVWDAANGCYGILGEAPDSIAVTLLYNPYLGPTQAVHFRIARDERHWLEYLAPSIRFALLMVALNSCRKEWTGAVGVDQKEYHFEVGAVPLVSPLDQIIQALQGVMGDLDQAPHAITIRIFDSN